MAADIQKSHFVITSSGGNGTLGRFCLCKAILNGVWVCKFKSNNYNVLVRTIYLLCRRYKFIHFTFANHVPSKLHEPFFCNSFL